MMTLMDKTLTTLYGIPNCDTVKKARAWLSARDVPYQFYDFKKQGVPEQALDDWITALGWESLVNTRGTTWRQLDDATRAAVNGAPSARALMLTQASVIKRPVVQWADSQISVGFDESAWALRVA
jgi:arsenate reductase